MRAFFPCSLLLASLAVASPAGAQLRLHGSAAVAHAQGGHQQRELGWGGAGLFAVELPMVSQVGAQLEVGSLWLGQGEAPEDPRLARLDAASALTAGLGLRLLPLAGASDAGPGGLWLSAVVGATRTGELFRPMLDAGLGYDVALGQGLGVGPMLGYLHVLQPDDALRPADARILLAGVHVVIDTAPAAGPSDRDNDTIIDPDDPCPDDPEDWDGFEDEGCPDLDNDQDGLADDIDQCPNVAEDVDGFEDGDGCPDLDNDRDGLADAKDRCPDDAEDWDGFEDADGCPDPDDDQDGIVDREDACPREPETPNGYADEDGCPDSEQVRVVGNQIKLDDRIHFATNSPQIRLVSWGLLQRLAKLIEEHPEYVVIHIYGHADQRGPDWFNDKLSQRRAESVLEFLVKHGIDRDRLVAKGFGESRPRAEGESEAAWFANRRVEFEIVREVKQLVRVGGPEAGVAPLDDAGGAAERAPDAERGEKPDGAKRGGTREPASPAPARSKTVGDPS